MAERPKRQLANDLRGIAQLATDATLGVTDIAEGVNQAVWSTLGVPGGKVAGRARGITGAVHGSVRGVARLVGKGTDLALASVLPLLDAETGDDASPRRELLLAALNGVMGDRLAASGNPLATPMSLRRQGRPLHPLPDTLPARVLLRVHGLCMDDSAWQPRPATPGNADALAAALGAEAIAVRYNSGQHISHNGRELALLLERLVGHWPVPIESISVVAHSMGGLVMRSALHQATAGSMQWPDKLKQLVFLGTPHHGAPLERAGHWVDGLLGGTAYSAPFQLLARLRSAGITDLRHGSLLDSDWHGSGRFEHGTDTRTPVPLPAQVDCFTIAATTSKQRGALADRLLGDGLVPLRSALGQHTEAQRALAFDEHHQHICFGMNHMQLLHHAEVTQQLLQWLAPR